MALSVIEQKQREALGRSGPFTIERASDTLRRRLLVAQGLPISSKASLGADAMERGPHWPEPGFPKAAGEGNDRASPLPGEGPLRLTLVDALTVAARNNRAYQSRKEDVFRAALDLDLEKQEFRNTFAGTLESVISTDRSGTSTVSGLRNTGEMEWDRTLKTGAALSARIAMDLVKLLTLDRDSAYGLLADATITIPLLAGSARHVVTEDLTQAEREVVYSLYALERFRRTLAVSVAGEYLGVLQQLDQVRNTQENYRHLLVSTRRARRLADAGRLPEIQVDQARQDELRARDRWIAARQAYDRRLDSFKLTLGVSTDARVEPDRAELDRLAETAARAIAARTKERTTSAPAVAADAPVELSPPRASGGGPLELAPSRAVKISLAHRLDLRAVLGRIVDAQRGVAVAADALQAGLALTGTAEAGGRRTVATAGSGNARLRPKKGTYTAGLLLDLPLERTAERNAYRDSYIVLARAVRDAQELEDQIKLAVRNLLRVLVQARESYRIQAEAARLAQRRVTSTNLFLQAGRAQIRDLLEAQEALVSALNARTAALVDYRVAELELQRDMGVLKIDDKGLWSEYKPDGPE